MAKNALPMFFRDPRTGSMKELAAHELDGSPPAGGKAGPGPARVLVADDDESDRLLTIWQLGEAWPGKEAMLVECAADGAEALEKIRGHRYALVVLDWNMPKYDGGEVLRTMRGRNLRIPVVVVSGERHESIASKLESMAATYVNKEELDAQNFRHAIVTSMQLQAGPGSHGSGLDPTRS